MTEELTGLGFPEALRWRDGDLWFSDMFRSQVIRWRPGEASQVVLDQSQGGPSMPGGLGWAPNGDLLVVDCLERKVLRLKPDGRLSVYADLSNYTEFPLNDMHVDNDGVAWVGGYGFDPENDKPRPSPIFRISPAGQVETSSPLFIFPNGCDRSGSRLVVAETFADRLTFFDEDLSDLQSFYFEAGAGPDGLSVDTAGNVLVALAFHGKIVRLSNEGVFETIFERESAAEEPGGLKGVFDCAFRPEDGLIAFSSACLDEQYAMANNTGSVTLVSL